MCKLRDKHKTVHRDVPHLLSSSGKMPLETATSWADIHLYRIKNVYVSSQARVMNNQ